MGLSAGLFISDQLHSISALASAPPLENQNVYWRRPSSTEQVHGSLGRGLAPNADAAAATLRFVVPQYESTMQEDFG
jgi:hypothetical protein